MMINKRKFIYKPTDSNKTFSVLFTSSISEARLYLSAVIGKYKNPILLFDSNLPLEYLEIVKKIITRKDIKTFKIETTYKSLSGLTKIWDVMINNIPDIVFVIGGGSLGDMAGFASNSYQRGTPRVYFPTTVLSQVDASIGGKTGIDYNGVKNAIGAVSYPLVVINYLPFLRSLKLVEFTSGFAEIVKAGVLDNPELFNKLNKIENLEKAKNTTLIADILYESARTKAYICEEKIGKKTRLLYGHSVGHAIEKLSHRNIRHGDAISIGINIEGALSIILGIWNFQEWKMQQSLLIKLKLPIVFPSDIQISKLIEKMILYKKLSDRYNLYFVLPDRLGHVHNQETNSLTAVQLKNVEGLIKKAIDFTNNN